MKVLVCGSRNYTDQERVWNELDQLQPDVVIAGGARGADTFAENWARHNDVPCVVFKAEWEKHGRSAGIIRNNQMLDTQPDLVLAFWDGQSPGTKHTIDRARSKGITTEVVYAEPEGEPNPEG